MHDSSPLTDENVLTELEFLSDRSDLCLVKIRCLNKSSGEVPRPNIFSALDQSHLESRLNWLVINNTLTVESILLMGLYAEKFLKLIRKLNRTSDSLKFEVAASLVGSADAFDFYQSAPFKAPYLIHAALKASQRRFYGFDWK